MIDLSELIHDPDFERDITIERTSGGHYEKSKYVSDTTVLLAKGIVVHPKGEELIQSSQGDRSNEYVDIYTDSDTPLYVTREQSNTENNISDYFIEDYNTENEKRYRITAVYDRSQFGFIKAQAEKVNAT